MFKLINFKSKLKNNPFAPEWDNHLVESMITNINTSKLSLPAFLTSSKAPAKSPLNTFLTALAKKPKVSK